MTTARARSLADQARKLAQVRADHEPTDPVVGALRILADALGELADQIDGVS